MSVRAIITIALATCLIVVQVDASDLLWNNSLNRESPTRADQVTFGDSVAITPVATVMHSIYLALAAKGNYVYAASWGGVAVADISNPNQPVVISEFMTSKNLNCHHWLYWVSRHELTEETSGKYLYVSGGCEGLRIFDVTDPMSPTLSHVFNPGDTLQNQVITFTISNNLLYLADVGGLYVLSIANPANPTIVSHLEDSSVFLGIVALAVKGSTLYVSWTRSGTDGDLRVFDVSNPSNPQLKTTVHLQSAIASMRVAGNNLVTITADPAGKLKCFDISSPLNPVLSDSASFSGSNYSVMTVSDSMVYLTGSKLYSLRASNQHKLIFVDSIQPTGPGGYSILAANGQLYLGSTGLQVVSLLNPVKPVLLGSVYRGAVRAVDAANGFA
jgi:hypothetical protein